MSTFSQWILDAAPFSRIAVGGMGLALVSCLLALLLRARLATLQRGPAFLILLCALSLLTATGAAIAGVEVGRGNLAEQLVAREAPAVGLDITRGIARQLACLALLGPIALVSLLSAGLLRWVSRKGPVVRPSRAAVVLRTVVVLPLLVGALGASAYGLWVHAGYVAITSADPPSKESAMLERLQQAYHLLRLIRAVIMVAAGAGLISAIAWARSAGGRPPGRARVAIAAATFAVGLGAFILTRAGAADRMPLTILKGNRRNSFGIVYAQEMPRFSRCLPAPAGAPVLEFSPNKVLFNRGLVNPGELHDNLATQRSLLPLLHPGEPLSPPALLVLADVATPTNRVIPYLEQAGEIEIFMVGSNPRPFASRTLGIIDRWEFCFGAFSLRPDGVSLSAYRTWRDLALAVERSGAVLGIAAR